MKNCILTAAVLLAAMCMDGLILSGLNEMHCSYMSSITRAMH